MLRADIKDQSMHRIYDTMFHYIHNAYYGYYTLAHDLTYFFRQESVNHIQSITKGILHLGELTVINAIR